MSFCFNFVLDEATSEDGNKKARCGDDDGQPGDVSNQTVRCTVGHAAGKELLIAAVEDFPDAGVEHLTLTLKTSEYLNYVESKKVEHKVLSRIEATDSKPIIDGNTDLVPHIYEGGLKIWECSLDLVEYLAEHRVDFCGKRVLELGCGAGLPGLFAALQGASVTFQDYNEDVISYVTIPNFKLNQTRFAESGSCRFFSGDWAGVAGLLEEASFDYILTSETIYSKDAYGALYEILSKVLKKSGVIYLAAKTCYFGVGGGTRDFERFVADKGLLEFGVCQELTMGVNREILWLKFKGKG